MTRSDRLLIVALMVLALAAWPLVASAGSSAPRVVISGPQGVTSVPLGVDDAMRVRGENGLMTVVVSHGAVRVTESGCPDQVCVKTGAVSTAGGVIVCVPNGVVVRVEGGEGDGFDARIH